MQILDPTNCVVVFAGEEHSVPCLEERLRQLKGHIQAVKQNVQARVRLLDMA